MQREKCSLLDMVDTTEIYFRIPGKVVPKQSTRFYNGHCVPQKRVTEYAKKVKAAYIAEYPFNRILWANKEPLEVVINIYMAVPKSASKKKRDQMILNERPTKIPDLDNCCKSVLDSCKGLIFGDDCHIVSLTSNKFWNETDWVEVTIREIKK